MNSLLDIFDWNSSEDFFTSVVENFHTWTTYDSANPLLFNSPLFLGLFFFFYLFYVLLGNAKHFLSRRLYLIVFSLFFYYKAGHNYYILLMACAVLTHWMSRLMYEEDVPWRRKLLMGIIVVANLGVLTYYKYTNFFIKNINKIADTQWELFDLILPIGISFFVFEAISYAVDLYRRQMEPAKSTLDFCFYITFFPKLVAGPIIRAKDFLPQMYEKLTLTKIQAGNALYLIILGLIKKAVISDYISINFVGRVFDEPLLYSPFETLMAVYGYALQIYCDFSGYSDMAIGLALLMGFTIPPNFETPYKSQSITEFWRRWHISLSSWLRDYLYISLGGNRKGKIRTYINLFLTMLIGGFWHGASWTYVVWGALHGTMLVVERFFKGLFKLPKNPIISFFQIVFTFHFVAFCWIFFRAQTFELAGEVITNVGRLTYSWEEWSAIFKGYQNVFILVAIGYVLHFLPEKLTSRVKYYFSVSPLILKAIVMAFAFWLVYATASSGPQPFIYFQF